MVSRPRCFSARGGADKLVLTGGLGVGSTSTTVATRAPAMRKATPKNGPRQLISPRVPPSSGPMAMPPPGAVSYSTIAPANPPLAEATMTASEVAMNSALPTPQPARNPMIALMVGEAPAAALNTTIRIRPAISVFLAPIRLDTQLVISMATAVTTRELVNSSVTSLGEACSWLEMAGRIGSTRPMPMNEMTQANATAKTALGWWNGLAAELAWLGFIGGWPLFSV